jgi:hypothetical protein
MRMAPTGYALKGAAQQQRYAIGRRCNLSQINQMLGLSQKKLRSATRKNVLACSKPKDLCSKRKTRNR